MKYIVYVENMFMSFMSNNYNKNERRIIKSKLIWFYGLHLTSR